MTGTPGEALDTDEAVRALAEAQNPDHHGGGDYEYEMLVSLNNQGVVLVWDGPRQFAESPENQHSPQTTDRPGGWVPGIGWVALLRDLDPSDVCQVYANGRAATADFRHPDLDAAFLVIVTRWAEGTVPTEGDR